MAARSLNSIYLATLAAAALLLLPSTAAPALAAAHPGSDPSQMTVVGSRVFFSATTAAHGPELWVTEGTKAGTHEVADISPKPAIGSSPHELTAFGTKVFFFADNGAADGAGRALWKSDGTAAGTKRLGPNGYGLTNVGGKLLFISEGKLWRSDGTVAGTRSIATFEGIFDPVAALDGNFYFFSRTYTPDWNEEIRLWKSDGTSAGTKVVALIAAPGDDEDYAINYQPVEIIGAGDLVYFLMEEPAAPCRGPADLWQSDGTAAGTHPVYDFDPSETVDYVDNGLTALGGTLYLGTHAEAGDALWKTNGSEPGTRIVKRINPAQHCGETAMTAVGSRLFLFADDGTGMALWRTKGTARTTVKVYPINLPGCDVYSNDPYCHLDETPVAFGSRLFFPAGSAGNGVELWVSDGTNAGTHMVKNIGYGAIGSQPSDLTTDGTRLFFSASDTVHGRELWVSNGTARGTHMVMDINPG